MQQQFIQELKAKLYLHRDSERALKMKSYMKSSMPYWGVSAPERKKILGELLKDLVFRSQTDWAETVRELWGKAQYREERYCAIDLTLHRSGRDYQNLRAFSLYEKMIVDGAWWDYVDLLASHNIGGLLRTFPLEMKKKMRTWSSSSHLWKRRTSILCQLGFGDETDLKLLYSCIEPSLDSKEFFLQKAIGWALRQYARTDSREVKRYLQENKDRISNLSRREALKHIESRK